MTTVTGPSRAPGSMVHTGGEGGAELSSNLLHPGLRVAGGMWFPLYRTICLIFGNRVETGKIKENQK